MAISKTRTIINAVELMRPMQGGYIFNDKLVDGTRSVKVWGWTDADYDNAKNMLERAGLAVIKKVRVKTSTGRGQYSVIRLLVKE